MQYSKEFETWYKGFLDNNEDGFFYDKQSLFIGYRAGGQVQHKYHLFGQEPNQTYCESCADFPCEATKNAMFCEGKNWREK